METPKINFKLRCSQRYYHVVALSGNVNEIKKLFTRSFGVNVKVQSETNFDEFNNVHFNIISDEEYYAGDLDKKDLSLEQNKEAPFVYDVFFQTSRNSNFVFISYPFKEMAKNSIKAMIANDLLVQNLFIALNFDKLILEKKYSGKIDDNYTTKVSGLRIGKQRGELTSLQLQGDNPTKSLIYSEMILPMLESGTFNIQRCSFSCHTNKSNKNSLPGTFSSLVFDSIGNCKFYLHNLGLNVLTVPLIYELFSGFDCLELTISNPLTRKSITKTEDL